MVQRKKFSWNAVGAESTDGTEVKDIVAIFDVIRDCHRLSSALEFIAGVFLALLTSPGIALTLDDCR